MKKKDYWNRPEMGFWEKIYLFEILRGLWVTFSVFNRNMFRWSTGRKGALTTYYPEEMRKDFSPQNRGRHLLTQRPDGSVQCIACQMCATVCPAKCIEIEADAIDLKDLTHPKQPKRFEIDYSRCIFCGFCVEACPEDAIRMVKDIHDLASYDRERMWTTKESLMKWNPQKDVSKPYAAKGKELRK